MSLYELTLVLKEPTDEVVAKTLVPGKIKSAKSWGVRDLAYPIKGVKRAGYFFAETELEKEALAAADKALKQNEKILRYLLISTG